MGSLESDDSPQVDTDERQLPGEEQRDLTRVVGWLQIKKTVPYTPCLHLHRMVRTLIYGGGYSYSAGRDLPDGEGFPDFGALKYATLRTVVLKKRMERKGRPVFVAIELTKDTGLFGFDGLGEPTEDAPLTLGPGIVGRPAEITIKVSADWVLHLEPKRREAVLFDTMKLIGRKGEELRLLQKWELGGHDIVVNRDTLKLYGDAAPDFHAVVASAQGFTQGALWQVGDFDQETKRRQGHEFMRAFAAEMGLKFYRVADHAILDTDGEVLAHLEVDDEETLDILPDGVLALDPEGTDTEAAD
jgi:hypothetical protein